MERILSAEQMRNADKFTIENLGVSSDTLIFRAGSAVADEIMKRFPGGRVLVCIGKGNNGADGKIVAELLSKKHGFTVATLNVYNGIFKIFDKKFDIIVDCIFGTGLNRTIDGKYSQAIEKINNSGAYIVSCDIPSGLNSDNGKVMGTCVKANLTIAIQEYKLGHFFNDGPDFCGEVVAKDIGISIWGDDFVFRINNEELSKFFPKRLRNVHKGSFNKCAVIGGSKQFFGSALLSANALSGLKMGVGYSHLIIPESLFSVYAGLNPECIIQTIPDKDGFFVYDEKSLKNFLHFDSIAFGMGVGVSEEVYKIIQFLLKNYNGKLLIDADGLNSLAKYGVDILNDKKCSVVLTPHVGEFSRLTGLEKLDIIDNEIVYVKDFAKKYNVTVLLKNAVSIISDGNSVYLNTSGCNGLAKAGSGDVLSGITAGLLSRTDDVFDAVVASAYFFGLCGEKASKKLNEYVVTATDVINSFADVINEL